MSGIAELEKQPRWVSFAILQGTLKANIQGLYLISMHTSAIENLRMFRDFKFKSAVRGK